MALLRGVLRSNELGLAWLRKAADLDHAESCLQLAQQMYFNRPYSRAVGHAVEAAGIATSARVMESHDVPPDVLLSTGCGRGVMTKRSTSTYSAKERWKGVSTVRTPGAW